MTEPPVLRASSPAELLQLIPYLLGFHPRESLVLVCLRASCVACTVRVDLSECRDVEDVAALMQRLWATTRMSRLIAVAFSSDPNAAVGALDLIESATPDIEIADLLRVDGDRWESLCTDTSGEIRRDGPMAAAAVYAGLGAAASRDDVATLMEYRPDAAGQPTGERALERVRWWDERRRRARICELLAADEDELSAGDLAEMACLISYAEARDAALLQIRQSNADTLLRRWLRVAQAIPDEPDAVYAVAMAGMCAWVAGEGALHVAAMERGNRIGASCGLLAVLHDIHHLALPPSAWSRLREQVAA